MPYPYRAMKYKKHITHKALALKFGVHRNTISRMAKMRGLDVYDLWSVVDFVDFLRGRRGVET